MWYHTIFSSVLVWKTGVSYLSQGIKKILAHNDLTRTLPCVLTLVLVHAVNPCCQMSGLHHVCFADLVGKVFTRIYVGTFVASLSQKH